MITKIVKKSPRARIPTRAHPDDVGYDLWIIDFKKKNKVGVEFYGTGLQVEPPPGYYFEIIPRSSISKTGYIQANGFGIIDPNYRGELMIPLLPLEEDAKLQMPHTRNLRNHLPYKIGQLVLRKVESTEFHEVDSLEDTDRGASGFGSTGT